MTDPDPKKIRKRINKIHGNRKDLKKIYQKTKKIKKTTLSAEKIRKRIFIPKKTKKQTKSNLWLYIIIVIVLVGIGILIWRLLSNDKNTSKQDNDKLLTIQPEPEPAPAPAPEPKPEPEGVRLPNGDYKITWDKNSPGYKELTINRFKLSNEFINDKLTDISVGILGDAYNYPIYKKGPTGQLGNTLFWTKTYANNSIIYYSWDEKTKIYEEVNVNNSRPIIKKGYGGLRVNQIGDKYHITFVGDDAKGLQGTLTPRTASYGSNKVKLGDWVEIKRTGYKKQVVGLYVINGEQMLVLNKDSNGDQVILYPDEVRVISKSAPEGVKLPNGDYKIEWDKNSPGYQADLLTFTDISVGILDKQHGPSHSYKKGPTGKLGNTLFWTQSNIWGENWRKGFIYRSWNDKTKLYEKAGKSHYIAPSLGLKVNKIDGKYHITLVDKDGKGLQDGTLTPYTASYGSNKVKLGDWVEIKGEGYTGQVSGVWMIQGQTRLVFKPQKIVYKRGKLYKTSKTIKELLNRPSGFTPDQLRVMTKEQIIRRQRVIDENCNKPTKLQDPKCT